MDPRRMHATFDEIEQYYNQFRQPSIRPAANDAALTEAEAAGINNLVDDSQLDADLLRAKKISRLGNEQPSTPMLWNGNPGSQQKVIDQSAELFTLAQVQGGPGDNRDYIVTLCALTELSGLLNGAGLVQRPVARITYGAAGGTQNVISVDWGQGGTVNVRGNFVRVDAQLGNSGAQNIGLNSLPLSAFISEGRSTTSKPTFTGVIAAAIAHGTAASLAIPQASRNVRFIYAPSTLTSVLLQLFDLAGHQMSEIDIAKNPTYLPVPIGAASLVKVVNNDAANPIIAESQFVFDLDL